MPEYKKLPLSFYRQEDVVELSKQLLGKFIFSYFDKMLTGGMIVETEAYRAPDDRASHAYGMRRTKRNKTLFEAGGCAYIYVCYGLYPLLNIVTNQEAIPHAILIRAIEPFEGLDYMLKRRSKKKVQRSLTAGPGATAQALGLKREHDGILLTGEHLWIEERGVLISSDNIIFSTRVGVDYAQEDAFLPWRFRIRDSRWTSLAK